MLPGLYPPEFFVLSKTRVLQEDERQSALKTLRERPSRILQAWAWGVLPWLLTALIVACVDRIPESPFFAGAGMVWMVGVVISTGDGVCQGIDIALESARARATLRNVQIEVWTRIPSTEDEDYFEDWPNLVEVIAGTDEIWREEWDGDGEEAQLRSVSTS